MHVSLDHSNTNLFAGHNAERLGVDRLGFANALFDNASDFDGTIGPPGDATGGTQVHTNSTMRVSSRSTSNSFESMIPVLQNNKPTRKIQILSRLSELKRVA